MSEQCGACKSERLEPAALASFVVLQRATSWKKATGGSAVTCRVCLDCGAIDRLTADTVKLQKMLPDP